MTRSLFLSAVHLFLLHEGQILLLRRFNTGYEDGRYSVPAGHIEAGESVTQAMRREAREEIGITIPAGELQVVHVMNRKSDDERIDFFLAAARWQGEIANCEPDKCDELTWAAPDALPANTISYVRRAIENYQAGRWFSEFGWD